MVLYPAHETFRKGLIFLYQDAPLVFTANYIINWELPDQKKSSAQVSLLLQKELVHN